MPCIFHSLCIGPILSICLSLVSTTNEAWSRGCLVGFSREYSASGVDPWRTPLMAHPEKEVAYEREGESEPRLPTLCSASSSTAFKHHHCLSSNPTQHSISHLNCTLRPSHSSQMPCPGCPVDCNSGAIQCGRCKPFLAPSEKMNWSFTYNSGYTCSRAHSQCPYKSLCFSLVL